MTAGLGGSLTERLQLVVDATTTQAEARFRTLTGAARETGEAATRSAGSVRAAADSLAAARKRQADAAGALNVAQARLTELQESGRARASQLAAAEERVASAQRSLHLATRATERATADQRQTQAAATTELERGAGASGRLREQTRGLLGPVLALGAVGLGEKLRGMAEGFADSARDAGLLGRSMNATTEQAGQFLGLVGALGLDLNDLLEIQAEFAQKVAANGQALSDLGVQTQRNADGTTNWALTLEDFLTKLQGVDDATERNRLGFQFLGEEGYKQLSRLVNSGTSVADALEKIGVPITDEDVAAAAEYDRVLMDASLAGQQLERTLGRALLPVLTGVAEGAETLAGVIAAIPLPVAMATAAAVVMGRTGFSPLAVAGGRVSVATQAAVDSLIRFRAVASLAGVGAATATAGMSALSAGGRGLSRLMGVLGGGLGVAMIGASVAFSEASEGSDELASHAHDAAVKLMEMAQAGHASADAQKIALGNQANDLEENAGYWERSAAYVKGYQENLSGVELAAAKVLEPFQRLTMGFGDTADTARGFELAIEQAKEELGAFGAQQAVAEVAVKTLNDLIAEGTTGGRDFGSAVQAAAEAQAEQERTSGLAEAAIAAYNATTRDAVQTTLDMWNAQLGARSSWQDVLGAIDAVNSSTDDSKTLADENAQSWISLAQTVSSYAGDAADAAVETAKANGQIVDSTAEAGIRAKATMDAIEATLKRPELAGPARAEIERLRKKLQEAQEAGDIEAVLKLTGAAETAGTIDETTKDRTTEVRVESRNGPAVISYLDRITGARRLALIRVETRNGPAVATYIGTLNRQRLALIRVESRNGPAVDTYLDNVASNFGQGRTAIIRVQRTGDVGPASGPTGRPAPGAAGGLYAAGGDVIVQQMTVQVQAEAGGRLTQQSLAEAGRQYVAAIGAYERRNGPQWRAGRSVRR